MALELSVIEQIKGDWRNAPSGGKSTIIRKWSETTGYSYAMIYRHMDTGRRRKKGERLIENIEGYVQVVAQIKRKPPERLGEVITQQAIDIAIKDGLIPPEMKTRASTFDRIIRELGMKKPRRVQRFQAEKPNEMHHIDASSSKSFYIHREVKNADGKADYVLRLHAGTKGYKNKPVPIRLRPWVYGLVDDYSGFQAARYVAAYGESAVDNLDFMCWAWGKNDDKPFFGLPDKLKGDLGPMMRGKDANDFFGRLGIEIDPSAPENKEAHGKIERIWRTGWKRFELQYFVQPKWKKFEILMSELNSQYMNYQQEYNEMSHRYEKTISRAQAWRRISLHGGAVALPEDALKTVARRIERTVGQDGCFSVDNVIYEVKGLHSAKAYVYFGVFDDKIVVVDKADGKKYEVEDFAPNPLGKFTGHKDTSHQKMVKAAVDLEVATSLYENIKDQGNLVQLPPRVKETRQIEDPLDIDTYPSLSVALQDFTAISGIIPQGDNLKAVQKIIIKNGLNRRFVKDLALEVGAENERSAVYG